MLDANIIGAELAAMSPLGLRRRRRGQGAWRQMSWRRNIWSWRQ
jgi:hypothetical protein